MRHCRGRFGDRGDLIGREQAALVRGEQRGHIGVHGRGVAKYRAGAAATCRQHFGSIGGDYIHPI